MTSQELGHCNLIEAGQHTAETMFESAKNSNAIFTWILRGVGAFLTIIAFSLVLKPLSVVADVVPFIGKIVAMGAGLVALLLGSVVALITISVAWIAYRPVVAVILLLVVAVLVYFLNRKSKTAQQQLESAVVQSPQTPLN
ncbi:MAG: hypothetical protein EOO68_30765 [Moraxellaceae bacterium]|nr:MAG: hypothetical protein EOO68_30765 [Moraxellaceae bacterium]